MNQIDAFAEFTDELLNFSSLGIRPGLERVSRLLSALGSPEKSFPAIHVLGTNGKGSTSATLESILRTSGLKTAMYTSPHLVSLQERLLVNGDGLPLEAWRRAFADLVRAVEADEYLSQNIPTFFENLTALCFLIIAREGIDIAILEAGMGGRYDATSSCLPIATLITPIGMDHMEYLGETIEAIASEKFAAIRAGVPAFYAGDDAKLTEQFFATCQEKGAPGTALDVLASVSEIACDLRGTSFMYSSGDFEQRYRTPLIGTHQAKNTARAITALREIRKSSPLLSKITDDDIARGVSGVAWPGRFEAIPGWHGAKALVLDGAHNDHGMRALIDTIQSMIAGGAFSGVSAVVYAVMKDKDIRAMLGDIRKLGAPLCATTLPMERAMPARELAEIAAGEGLAVRGAFDDPQDALREAAALADPGRITLCCGSLYFIGHLKHLLLKSNDD